MTPQRININILVDNNNNILSNARGTGVFWCGSHLTRRFVLVEVKPVGQI
jgi:hypothetical protein